MTEPSRHEREWSESRSEMSAGVPWVGPCHHLGRRRVLSGMPWESYGVRDGRDSPRLL